MFCFYHLCNGNKGIQCLTFTYRNNFNKKIDLPEHYFNFIKLYCEHL